jgi:hypothetical protein
MVNWHQTIFTSYLLDCELKCSLLRFKPNQLEELLVSGSGLTLSSVITLMKISWNLHGTRRVEFIKISSPVLNDHNWKLLLEAMSPKKPVISALRTNCAHNRGRACKHVNLAERTQFRISKINYFQIVYLTLSVTCAGCWGDYLSKERWNDRKLVWSE